MYFDNLDFLFVQEYFEGCRDDIMEGTKKYPAFIMGQVQACQEKIIIIAYKEIVGKSRPGFITPSFLKCERYNLQFGKTYYRKVMLQETVLPPVRHEFHYMIEIDTVSKEIK